MMLIKDDELKERLESLLTVVYLPEVDEIALCFFGGTGEGFSIETRLFKPICDPTLLKSIKIVDIGDFI